MQNTAHGLIGMFLFSACLLGVTWLAPVSIMTLIIPVWCVFFFSGMVFPNSMTKIIALFSHSAGTVAALYGTWLGVVVSIMTAVTGVLNINSQQSLAMMFLSMVTTSVLLFVAGIYLENSDRSLDGAIA